MALVAVGADAAHPCETSGESRRAESPRYVVAYRTDPAALRAARHFALEVVVCAKSGAPAAESLRVDATMPEHGHGMGYAPSVKPLGAGRFRAEGLMFHMPGRWRLVFEIGGESAVDELVLR